jgi:hypothetical protein
MTGRRAVIVAALVVAGVATALAAAGPVQAHAFGQRYDLPVPLWYFVAGAAAAVAFSFVMVGIFIQGIGAGAGYPTWDLMGRRWFRLTLGSPATVLLVKLASVFVFGLVIATSFWGSEKPLDNLSPTFIWVIWWIGTGFVSATIGNVWAVVNPWKIVFEWVETLLAGRGGFTSLQRYPKSWSVWPALVLFGVFAWLENVYTGSAVPNNIGIIIIVFSIIQWAGMFYFGKNAWLRNGDPLAVLFGLFARFSITEVRVAGRKLCRRCELDCGEDEGDDCAECYACFERAGREERRVLLRPPAAGLIRPERVSTALTLFVILALSTVTFDGLKETPFWNRVHRDLEGLGLSTVDTIGLFGIPFAFMAIYLGFSWTMRRLSGNAMGTGDTARAFVLSLIPIALAYHFAHFLALLLIQGQVIVPLVSDPFGKGWDLFGSGDYTIDIGVINARAAWFYSIAVIVVGHVAAVFISHVIALRKIRDHDAALASQYPMLVLMVFYTAVSLWIISQPIVQ